MSNKKAIYPFLTVADFKNVAQRPGEVIYQIYPASFADANGDGLGDLKGITSKLDYIKSLGVDSLWISPFYDSPPGPEGDGGYAVSDYRAIANRFGSMADFQDLLNQAHARDLRVYIDFVIAHTAHDHEWFEKSRRREAPYTDYYVWHDGYKVDRGQQTPPEGWEKDPKSGVWIREGDKWFQIYPPNNWKSVFGGIAWEWDNGRKQYYMHHFLKTQPSLNLNSKKIQDASLAEMKFWLDMGVDGFRIDALPFANFDPQFRHNPWQDDQWPRAEENWSDQYFEHSLCQPQTLDLVARIRELLDSYPDKRTALGEAVCGPHGGGGSTPVAASYVDPQKGLDMCYTDILTSIHEYPSQDRLKKAVAYLLETFPETGGHCNSADNHDTPRSASRMLEQVPQAARGAALRQIIQLFTCLPGSFSMYQGQELGLPQASIPEDIPWEMLQDPTAGTLGNGRDGCRTPMPWKEGDKNLPYLPLPHSHEDLAVNRQEAAPDSQLHFTRRLLAWRAQQPALIHGETIIIDNPGDVFAFVRRTKEQTLLCLFNMGGKECDFKPADYMDETLLKEMGIDPQKTIRIKPYGAGFYGANAVPRPANKPTQKPKI